MKNVFSIETTIALCVVSIAFTACICRNVMLKFESYDSRLTALESSIGTSTKPTYKVTVPDVLIYGTNEIIYAGYNSKTSNMCSH